MINLTEDDYKIIRELSKTKYDAWVEPPPMSDLVHMLPFKPKNYTTISKERLGAFLIKQLAEHEPLVSKFSDENRTVLLNSIRIVYATANVLDLANGGDGLIKPTFMEIMSSYIFRIREYNHKDLVTNEDKAFFHKYFWCFHERSKLLYNQSNKSA